MLRVALVTDFGSAGPYTGQVRCVLNALVPGVPVIELISDLTPFRPDLAAYLLPALVRNLPEETLYLCVVDPGVGGERDVVALEAGGSLFLAPDNGLLSQVARRWPGARVCRLGWRPTWMSESFHGRDLFVPLAARMLNGEPIAAEEVDGESLVGASWPGESRSILYVDQYGNLMTGLRATGMSPDARIRVGGRDLSFARTFCAVAPKTPFWYENAFGLVELAVCQGRADLMLGLTAGDTLDLIA